MNTKFLLFSIATLACLGFIFADGLIYMENAWNSEEYSHGYLIPVISLWFVWENQEELKKYLGRGDWSGVLIVILGLIIGFFGELATLYVITQYAFLLTLYGLCVVYFGWRGMRLLWFPLAYLFFMIPLPNFLYNNLSSQLQLISSQLGVAVARGFDVSVHLQGNVIDLGVYQLQVVEACSGLRYLFPLASFGFLSAFFFKAPLWMRGLVLISTLPITVLMNSFRIGVICVLVEHWGIEQAEGFLHDFEGWIVFIGCLAVLFAEMWLLTKLFIKDKSFSDVFIVDGRINTKPAEVTEVTELSVFQPYIIAALLLFIAVPLTLSIGTREELVPERSRFADFPLQIEDWQGVSIGMGQKYIDTLKFDDYIVANYAKNTQREAINFYVAYYSSQRKGASIHSPKSCLPGDGWRIGVSEQYQIDSITSAKGEPLEVNRVVISKGRAKQLVYYWFQQRGRAMTNEYLVKWFLFWDSLTQHRTDGALVRLVISLPPNVTDISIADKQLEDFLKVTFPVMKDYIPD